MSRERTPTVTEPAPEYLTTAELARLLRKEPATIRQMRHRGSGPRGTRVGRDVLYDRGAVDAWLKAKSAADEVGQRADRG